MRWGNAGWWWMAALPLLVVALLAYGHLVRRHLTQVAGEHRLVAKLLETFSLERRLFKHLLVVLGVTLATVAALRPQYGSRPDALRPSGIDIAVAFDISKSMLARDVVPSRLQGARDQLDRLMKQLTGDRTALVPFAGIAFTQSPLTHDRAAIRLYLDSLDPMQMPVGGTNLAMAVKEGTRLLTGDEDRGDKQSRSRVLLLITDGEDVASDQGEAAKAAAKEAGEKGIQIFAIAVGTRLGEPIPLLDEDGKHQGYQKDQAGKPIYSKLNIALLEDLARLADPAAATDARRVFQYDGSEQVADAVADELDTLQKSAVEAAIRHTYGEKFQWALLPAIALLLVELLVGERRRRRPGELA